jgi:hypothetical protein
MARGGIRVRLGIDSEDGRQQWDDRIALLTGTFAALLIVTALLGAVVMFARMYITGPLPPTGNPLKVVFASRLMVAGARLTILFVGVYLIVSILMHMKRGQWITGYGPLKVSDAVRALSVSATAGREDVERANNEADRLRALASELRSELRTTETLLQQAQEQLNRERKR